MELKKIRKKSKKGYEGYNKNIMLATLTTNGLYLNKKLSEKIKQYKYAEISYACTDDGLMVVLKLLKKPTADSYKIRYNNYSSALIYCTQLSNLLVTTPRISTNKIELKDDELWLYFRKEEV